MTENSSPELDYLDGRADEWSARVNLIGMIENAVSPMRLNRSVPDAVRESFRKRMIEQIDAIVRQAFVEGAIDAVSRFPADGPRT